MSRTPHYPMCPSPRTDTWNERMVTMALDLCRNQAGAGAGAGAGAAGRAGAGLSDLELIGAWGLIARVISHRQAVCVVAFNAGLTDLAMATLLRSPPADWIDWHTHVGVLATAIIYMMLCVWLGDVRTFNFVQLSLDSGFASAMVSSLQVCLSATPPDLCPLVLWQLAGERASELFRGCRSPLSMAACCVGLDVRAERGGQAWRSELGLHSHRPLLSRLD